MNTKTYSKRRISSSQKGMENVAEGTKYDDYHIDTNGMGILSVGNIIEEIEGRGNQAVLTVQTSDGSTNHSQFGSKDWKEYKDSVNDAGNAITDVWVTEVEGGSYVRNSRQIKSSKYRWAPRHIHKEDVKIYFNLLNNLRTVSPTNATYELPVDYYGYLAKFCEAFNLDSEGKDLNKWYLKTTPSAIGADDYFEVDTDTIDSITFAMEDYLTDGIVNGIPVESSRKITSSYQTAINELEEYFESSGSGNDDEYTIYTSVLSRDDKNHIAKICEDNDCDFAIGTSHVTIYPIESSHKITSARYIATDPESGEVLGSADTYEEAVNEWGEDVTITDSEAAEGQENMEGGLFSNRQIKSSMFDDENEIELSSDKPNYILRLFDHNGGNIFAEEGFDTKAEAIKWASENGKGFDAALWDNINGKPVKEWKIKSSRKITSAYGGDTWHCRFYDEYDTLFTAISKDKGKTFTIVDDDSFSIMAKEDYGLNPNQTITKDYIDEVGLAYEITMTSSRKITSAVDGGWEVRSSDVPEALDLFVEYFGEEDALEEIAKAMGDDVLQENIEWVAQQWGFGEEIEGLDVWEQYEMAKEYMGVSELFNNLTQAAGYDELAADLAFIFRMNDFREWDKYDNKDSDDYDEWEDDEEIESSLQNSFPIKTVKNIMSGIWTEKQAAQNIAQKQNINVGYAKQILSSWIEQYKPKLIKSGVLDVAEDINTDFDIDGDLESWAEQYTNPEGKSNTVGGEMVRAAMQIIYRYNNDGDMIGRGYGNETVNAAARYITEKAEMGVNEQIQKWLDHEERADDYDYDNFIETFTTEIEQILRENPELFQKPNNDDYWDWKEDEDMNYGLDECYLDDGDGNQYWFQLDNDRWTCTGIELDPNAVTYSEGDTINEGDEYSDEIDHTEEFGSFEADGFIYEYAGDNWDDEREEYTSWQITKVVPEDPYCDEGDTLDFYDLEPDELSGFRLFDNNGNEIDERTFLASSLKIK